MLTVFVKNINRTCNFLCKKLICYLKTNKTQVTDKILKLILIHSLVIYDLSASLNFPEFTKFIESSAPSRKLNYVANRMKIFE